MNVDTLSCMYGLLHVHNREDVGIICVKRYDDLALEAWTQRRERESRERRKRAREGEEQNRKRTEVNSTSWTNVARPVTQKKEPFPNVELPPTTSSFLGLDPFFSLQTCGVRGEPRLHYPLKIGHLSAKSWRG